MIADRLRSGLHEFYDYFERSSVGPLWDSSEVSSASISSGKLVVVPNSNTWGSNNGVIYVNELHLSGDFEVEAKFDYESGGSRDLGFIGIYLSDSSVDNFIMTGMGDNWADHSGEFRVTEWDSINGATYAVGTGYDSRPSSGTMTVKIIRTADTIEYYENGVKRGEDGNSITFTKLKLVNYAYLTYNYKTAYWDYIKVRW